MPFSPITRVLRPDSHDASAESHGEHKAAAAGSQGTAG